MNYLTKDDIHRVIQSLKTARDAFEAWGNGVTALEASIATLQASESAAMAKALGGVA